MSDQERNHSTCPHCETRAHHSTRPPRESVPGLPWEIDERRFVFVRICNECGWEWGQA